MWRFAGNFEESQKSENAKQSSVGIPFLTTPFLTKIQLIWDRFGVDLGSMWGRLGVDLGSIWGRFWVDLGSAWGRFGIDLGSVWDQFGIDWGQLRVELGSIWGRFGVGLGSVWDRFGVGSGLLWGRFVRIWGKLAAFAQASSGKALSGKVGPPMNVCPLAPYPEMDFRQIGVLMSAASLVQKSLVVMVMLCGT